MNIFDSIILGVVEGITEFLPVSSTGHMILTSHLLDISKDPFTKSFEVIIQLGAILAIVYLYRKTIVKDIHSMLKVLLAFIPTAIIGFMLYGLVKRLLLGNPWVVVISLFVGGLAIILFEKYYTKADEVGVVEGNIFKQVSYKQSVIIGLWQTLAMIPGVSRSAATIIGGETLRIPRKTIVEFSFLLAIPTMLAASALDIYKHPEIISEGNLTLLATGFITAFLVALVVVRYFLLYIQKNSFAVFGYYRIIIAVVYALFFLW
ncbi:MAG: undecaprenyl-diphosphatase UppP [Candidatus Taylorbacteria bacterium]|nr:undecaprenyl-diphosphatase UppP [Candidatus Taylorbacteria bacterium]